MHQGLPLVTAHRKARRRLVATADHEFDELIAPELRHLSHVHWTPISVAIRAATLLCPAPNMKILDVGAGIGKLCMVGAMSSESTWCGVERHESLVAAARKLSRALGVADQTMFVHGDAFAIDWAEFDALYFYNPFEFEGSASDPAQAEERLAGLPQGVRVVTLNGFGGSMPPSYRLVYHERISIMELDLVLWVQGSSSIRRVSVS